MIQHHFALTQMGEAHVRELRRQATLSRPQPTSYPDRERQPRIAKHWVNR